VSAPAKAVIVDSNVDESAGLGAGLPAANNLNATVIQTATVTPIQAAISTAGAPAAGAPVIANSQIDSTDKSESQNNLIKRTVDEIYGLMTEVHEIREELLAHGIHFHMLNALIEVGIQGKVDEFKEMSSAALEASVKAFGPQAIEREELETHLEEIIVLEKDLRHVRNVAKQQGVHMQALNHLTQLMRLNPGDKGVQAINTFIAYADATGVPLDRLDAIRKKFKEGPKSVLPDVPRELASDSRDTLKQLATNILLGLILTGIMMWFVQ
jgi:hypothetical protein